MKKRRNLSAEEQALWDEVARKAEPLQKPAPFARPIQKKPDVKHGASGHAPFSVPAFKLGQKASAGAGRHDLAPSVSQHLNAAPVQMDHKAFGRMKRGKLAPEARIDLHGMTLAQAHPALTGFILRSASAGHRLVLVITGKGKNRDDGNPIPTRFGVLRHQVPLWLRMAPVSGLVLQVTPAHIRHGGEGAYYVYLRRTR